MALNIEQYKGLTSAESDVKNSYTGAVNIAAKIKRMGADTDGKAPAFVADAFDIEWTGYKINNKDIKCTGDVIEAINGGAGNTSAVTDRVTTLENTVGKPGEAATDDKEAVPATGLHKAIEDALAAAEQHADTAIDNLDVTGNTSDAVKGVTVTVNETDGKVTKPVVGVTATVVTAGGEKDNRTLTTDETGNVLDESAVDLIKTYVDNVVSDALAAKDAAIDALDKTNNISEAVKGITVTVNEENGVVDTPVVGVTAATVTSSGAANSRDLKVTANTGNVLDSTAVAQIKDYIDNVNTDNTTADQKYTDDRIGAIGTETDGAKKTVKSYVDAAVSAAEAAAKTVVAEGDGITVTPDTTAEDGHTKYTISSNAVLDVVSATEDAEAKLVLKDKNNKELTSINISQIIGTGILTGSEYSKETGKLKLTFAGSSPVEVDLGALLDVNDTSVAADSQKYLGVTLTGTGENDGTQAVFDIKTQALSSASATATGLVDAFDAKTYIDGAVAGKNVDAEGDSYVSASASNNKVEVKANIAAVSESTTSHELSVDATDKLLSGTAISTIESAINDKISDAVSTLTTSLEADVTSDDNAVANVEVKQEGGVITDVVVTNISAGVTAGTDNLGLAASTATGAVTGADIATIKDYIDTKVSTSNTAAIEGLDVTNNVSDAVAGVSVTVNETDGKVEKPVVAVADNAVAYVLKTETDAANLTVADTTGVIKGQAVAEIKKYVDAVVGDAISDANSAIEALDVAEDTVGDGNVTVTYSETDGKVAISDVAVSETAATYTEASGENKADLSVATADAAKLLNAGAIANIKSYVDAHVAEEIAAAEKVNTVASDSTNYLEVSDNDHELAVKTSLLGEVGLTKNADGEYVAGTNNAATGLATAADVAAEIVNDEEVVAAALNDHESRIAAMENWKVYDWAEL